MFETRMEFAFLVDYPSQSDLTVPSSYDDFEQVTQIVLEAGGNVDQGAKGMQLQLGDEPAF